MDISRLPDQLRSKIEVCGDCWIWMAHRDQMGYGRVTWRSQPQLAHRAVYAVYCKVTPPVLDHLCRHRACVNPAHLDGVTLEENLRRGKGHEVAAWQSERWAVERSCPQGHPLSGENLYVHRTKKGALNRQCRTCRRESKRRRRASGARE